MKLKSIKSSDLTSGLVQVAGAGVGFMLPNGIANAVAKVDDENMITDDQKKTKMFVNLGALALGVYGMLAIDGNDTTAVGLRALSTGFAGGGAKGLITHFAAKKVQELPASTAKTLVAGALGCPCNASMPSNFPVLQMPRSLRMPMPLMENVNEENILENFSLQG